MGKPLLLCSQQKLFITVTIPYSPRYDICISKSSRTLLVVTTGDLEDVTLELITEGVAGNL